MVTFSSYYEFLLDSSQNCLKFSSLKTCFKHLVKQYHNQFCVQDVTISHFRYSKKISSDVFVVSIPKKTTFGSTFALPLGFITIS